MGFRECLLAALGVGAAACVAYFAWFRDATSTLKAGGCDVESRPATSCIVYSFGSDRDFQFERGLSEVAPRCEIHLFDAIVSSAPENLPPTARYHALGLGAQDGESEYPDAPLRTLRSIMRELNHDHIDVLSLDVELGEWSVVRQWAVEGDVPRVGQIQLSVHVLSDFHPPEFTTAELTFVIDFLEAHGFRLFQSEPNSGCATCHELAFASVEAALGGSEQRAS